MCMAKGLSKMMAQEDPELTPSHKYTKYTPIYRAIPPEKHLKAD